MNILIGKKIKYYGSQTPPSFLSGDKDVEMTIIGFDVQKERQEKCYWVLKPDSKGEPMPVMAYLPVSQAQFTEESFKELKKELGIIPKEEEEKEEEVKKKLDEMSAAQKRKLEASKTATKETK